MKIQIRTSEIKQPIPQRGTIWLNIVIELIAIQAISINPHSIPNFPTTNGGQTVGLQQAPTFPKEGFGEECKYNRLRRLFKTSNTTWL